MENGYNKKNICTVTGVFATKEDAENAYHILIDLGYTADEITLIMSDETQNKLAKSSHDNLNVDHTIADIMVSLGKFVAFPGVALMVAGDFNDGGVRALTGSVMSDIYAQYYRTRIKDGEIVIDFRPRTVRERNMITDLWENYGGYPLIRVSDAA
ncbi:hypothetical protein [Dyadobacter sp. NIV53]|uniref:hypothetical protein n=1 Tax=Dyadobacter sp. NIV53 TaxID=2861765 RepID=UPI001C8698FC|nr:hypothetical protein [Dyadobacter sp. NIV53]